MGDADRTSVRRGEAVRSRWLRHLTLRGALFAAVAAIIGLTLTPRGPGLLGNQDGGARVSDDPYSYALLGVLFSPVMVGTPARACVTVPAGSFTEVTYDDTTQRVDVSTMPSEPEVQDATQEPNVDYSSEAQPIICDAGHFDPQEQWEIEPLPVDPIP